jgi:hypothetical protein
MHRYLLLAIALWLPAGAVPVSFARADEAPARSLRHRTQKGETRTYTIKVVDKREVLAELGGVMLLPIRPLPQPGDATNRVTTTGTYALDGSPSWLPGRRAAATLRLLELSREASDTRKFVMNARCCIATANGRVLWNDDDVRELEEELSPEEIEQVWSEDPFRNARALFQNDGACTIAILTTGGFESEQPFRELNALYANPAELHLREHVAIKTCDATLKTGMTWEETGLTLPLAEFMSDGAPSATVRWQVIDHAYRPDLPADGTKVYARLTATCAQTFLDKDGAFKPRPLSDEQV